MALCWPGLFLRLLLLLSIYSTRVDASISLSNKFINFIPSCAETCFESFLENNFPTICGSSPSLDCLCSHNSTSGYTVGEGAIQCILSEVNVGFCKGADAGNDVAANAFSMCNGQENAIPNTHKTITATVVVQSSMPSIVLIAPAATFTSSSSSSFPSSSSTSQSRSNTPKPTKSTTSTGNPSKTSNTSTATAAEASSGAAGAAAALKATDPTLTKSQKIAIAVASVGGVAVVAGLLLLFLCLRRRRQRSRDSDMLPFQAEPGTPKFYGGFRGPMEAESDKSSPTTWGKKAPRVPPRLDTSDPYMFSRSSIRPETIGVAISPERNIQGYAIRSSRLLPDKPTLKINTNQQVLGAVIQSTQANRQLSRQSTATEFEEEDNSSDTAIDEYYGRGSIDRILPKEEAPDLKTIKVIQPENQSSFYITNPDNPSQNQELTTSPESYIKPLNIARGVNSFSRPRPGPDPRALQLQVPSQIASNNLNTHPITAGSSIYSSATNTPYTAAPSTGPLTGNPFPIPLSNINLNRNESLQEKRKSYKQIGPYDRVSNGSFTSFDSEDSSPDEHPRHTLMLDLSPVAESPASASGRSPVSYPKIAPGRLTKQTIRMVPPPPQPDFASVFSSGGRRSQPFNNTQPFNNNNTVVQKPWQAAEILAARQRRLSAAQTQSGARSQTYPKPQTQVQTKPATAEEIRQNQNQNPYQATISNPEKVAPKLASPFQPQPTYQSHTRQRSRDYIAPSAHFNSAPSQGQLRSNAHVRDGSQTPSIVSFASQNSTSSSLLAKRLGTEKAAQLSLQTQTKSSQGKQDGKDAKWRVLSREERERAKEVGWKPQLAGRVEAGRGGGGGQPSVDLQSGGYLRGERDLPRTPGWVPRLTPTRRGDELFLSVA